AAMVLAWRVGTGLPGCAIDALARLLDVSSVRREALKVWAALGLPTYQPAAADRLWELATGDADFFDSQNAATALGEMRCAHLTRLAGLAAWWPALRHPDAERRGRALRLLAVVWRADAFDAPTERKEAAAVMALELVRLALFDPEASVRDSAER